MFQLDTHGSFILLAIIFGLLAESVFLINNLIDKNSEKARWNIDAEGVNKAEKIIKWLIVHLRTCFGIALLLIVRIGLHGLSYDNLGFIDTIILISFLIMTVIMIIISFISYKFSR